MILDQGVANATICPSQVIISPGPGSRVGASPGVSGGSQSLGT